MIGLGPENMLGTDPAQGQRILHSSPTVLLRISRTQQLQDGTSLILDCAPERRLTKRRRITEWRRTKKRMTD
jgi:hypothetical protein